MSGAAAMDGIGTHRPWTYNPGKKYVWTSDTETGDPERLPAQVLGDGVKRRHDESNELAKEGALSFLLFESPFTTVSKQSAGATPLLSLWF
jgi:hypothetical protein